MIRTFTFVIIIVLAVVNLVSASEKKHAVLTQLILEKNQLTVSPDTIFNPQVQPLLSFENLTYKLRLDSLQKDIPLTYNEFVQSYIDIYVQRKEQVGKMLGLSKYYFPIFEKALKEAGLPDEIKFITVIESSLNPHAVSRSGAVGPWQFMYTTAKGYGLLMDSYVDERKDPVKASYAAAHYFMDAYSRIGDWLLTIAAFNCGTGAVTRAIERSGGVADFWKVRAFLPRETQNYVPAFIATVYAMNYYQNHNIEVKPAGFGLFTDIIPVNKRISISSLAKATNLDLQELLILNPSYKKEIINGSIDFPKSLVIPGVGNDMYSSIYEVLNGSETAELPVVLAAAPKTYAEPKEVKPKYHKVKSGQNLSNIANQYGVEVQDLKVWNNLKSSSIVPGQNIRLVPENTPQKKEEAGYFSYIVKVGDTLSDIADKFTGVTVSKIKALNGLTRSAIIPGMKLKINRL
jgi:membrane-bound lytic murein transglycosylase D